MMQPKIVRELLGSCIGVPVRLVCPALRVTKMFKDVSVPFWNQLPSWIEKNDLSPTTWQVVDGLDAKKINDLLDGYVQHGKNQLKPHVHI